MSTIVHQKKNRHYHDENNEKRGITTTASAGPVEATNVDRHILNLDEIPLFHHQCRPNKIDHLKLIDNYNTIISLVQENIVNLKIDCIVNAANKKLRKGSGVDGVIRNKAGPEIEVELQKIGFCETGNAVITDSYNAPSKAIIHTVGPIIYTGYKPTTLNCNQLSNCYQNSLYVMKFNQYKSIAFPCISTGVYGFPKQEACQIAIKSVKDWLFDNHDYQMDRIIFCVFSKDDYHLYKRIICNVFFQNDN